MDVLRTFVVLLMFARLGRSTFLEDNSPAMCPSPQYLKMGSTSTVQCLFYRDFYAVLWYNTTNYPEEDPIFRYQNMVKYGPGYNSGEFDIHPNGSLIINHVSLSHDHTFKVGYVHSHSAVPVLIDVEIIVTVNPPIPFRVLKNCGNATNKCYSAIEQPFFECSVRGSRPAVFLNLTLRTVSGDRDISNETLTIQNGVGYTSLVTTKNLFDYSSLLVLLVCKASGPPGILSEDESMSLVQRSKIELNTWEPTRIYVKSNNVMELKCTGNHVGFLLWKKVSSPEVQELLMYAVFIKGKFTEIFARDFSLGSNGSLITNDADLRHEGSYLCLFGDGETDGVTTYEVTIIVYPVPAYPVIDGCAHDECCVLQAQRKGNLTCKVTGIRPKAQLEWGVLSAQGGTPISFTRQTLTEKDNGDTFDLTLTAIYNILESHSDRVTVECRISLPEVFHLSSQVDLVFVEDVHPTELAHFTKGHLAHVNWVLLHVIITTLSVTQLLTVVVLTSIAITVYAMRKRDSRKRKTCGEGDEQGESSPLRVVEGGSGTSNV